jgi:hypothetical protein
MRALRQCRQELRQAGRKIGLRAIIRRASTEQAGQCQPEILDGVEPGRPGVPA